MGLFGERGEGIKCGLGHWGPNLSRNGAWCLDNYSHHRINIVLGTIIVWDKTRCREESVWGEEGEGNGFGATLFT